MKATGIVRKIDDLGRIVIPKEIRKGLRIRVGDPLEIYVEKNGEIILKKYAPMGDLLEICDQYASALYTTTNFSICITDRDSIVAIAGCSKKEYLDKDINEEILNILDERKVWYNKNEKSKDIIKNESNSKKYICQIISPIISDGDIIGSVIMFSTDNVRKITDVEIKAVETASIFLGEHMNQ